MTGCSINSFSSLIQTLRQFVHERNWEQYHTPRNIALALSGECGELSAIFQWKEETKNGDMFQKQFTSEELIHLGEEIADVFVYTTRLSDILGPQINVVATMKSIVYSPQLSCSSHSGQQLSQQEHEKQEQQHINDNDIDITFTDALVLITHSPNYFHQNPSFSSSPRNIIFQINSSVGIISNLFSSYNHESTTLDQWKEEDVTQLSIQLTQILIHLIYLASLAGLQIGDILFDKITKNGIKYPVHLARGSSKKYTAYQSQTKPQPTVSSSLFSRPLSFFSHFLPLIKFPSPFSVLKYTVLASFLGFFTIYGFLEYVVDLEVQRQTVEV